MGEGPFNFGLVCLAFSPGSFILARDFFYFGLVALHLAQVLFNLATVLFNVGLVCLAFNPSPVYFG